MKKRRTYLDRLKFDPALLTSIQAKYLKNVRLMSLLVVTVILLGIVNFISIPRRLNPEIDIAIVTVSTVFPGASPEDVEALVTIPLEDELQSIENVDVLTSNSQDNVSVVVLQFLSSVSSDDARNKTQEAVDSVSNLPDEAQTPLVTAIDFEDQPVWTFALHSEKEASLMIFAQELVDRLENETTIDRVLTSGTDDQKIYVTVDPIKMTELGLSEIELSQLVSQASNSYPAGTVETGSLSFTLGIDPAITTIDDIREIRLNKNGSVISLGEIASVSYETDINRPKTIYADKVIQGQPTVQFFVYKTKSTNINKAGEDAQRIVSEKLQGYEDVFTLQSINNTAADIDDQFSDLIGEFRTTIILIFINLLIFLGLRQALIASFTVPLTFLSAITIAQITGMSLNFLTLFSFLLALGLLIDDTIVVISAMTRYYSTGKFTPYQSALLVWKDFFIPLWATTATTVWSFVPLLLSTGIIGEFIKPIPIIVTATMLSSTSIAVLVTLPFMIIFLKLSLPYRLKILGSILLGIAVIGLLFVVLPKNMLLVATFGILILLIFLLWKRRKVYITFVKKTYRSIPHVDQLTTYVVAISKNGLINLDDLSQRYKKLLVSILSNTYRRRMTAGFIVIFALLAYVLVPLGLVGNEFFPRTDQSVLYLGIDLPTGTTISEAENELTVALNKTRSLEHVEYIIAETGVSLGSQGERETKSNSILLTIHIGEPEDRSIPSFEIADTLRSEFASYSKGDVSVREESGGPPAGADIQITLLGEDLSILDSLANTVVGYLESTQKTTNVEKSITSGTSKLVFVPDENKLSQIGIPKDQLGLVLRTYTSNFTLDSIRFNDEVDVVLRVSDNLLSPEDLSAIQIPSQTGPVPILELGDFQLKTNPTRITREDGKRTITISASAQQSSQISQLNSELETFVKEEMTLPDGYSWKTGGVNEENQKSVNSIIQAMGLAFLLILITMVIEFNSYRQALIILLTIPLAISGVFYMFALTGTPLSFPSLIGVLALFGIVVNNAIVIVDKSNNNLKENMKFLNAVADASASRLEPIFLTSLTTIVGLLPITLSDPLWRGLGGAIIAGLLFSGFIMLFFVPILYYSWFYKNS